MSKKPKGYQGLECEPDYGVTMKCCKCGVKEVVSSEWIEFHEIDTYEFVCSECSNEKWTF